MLWQLKEGAIKMGPSASNWLTFSTPLLVYYQLVSVITVVVIATHHLHQLSRYLCNLIHPASLDYASIMGLWGGLFLAIVAVFLPPLSVLKRTGCDHHLFINIVLTLFGWTPGILHAWYIILRFPDGRRAAELREDVKQGRAKVVYQGFGLPAIGAGTYYFPAHQETRIQMEGFTNVNDENAPVADEPLTTLYIEETGPQPVEAALATRLSEPILDEEPSPDGELISVGEPSRLSYSSMPYITEEARAW
ncbi:hypothetical protein KCU64_g4029, partial [Aureobasidium melanogenum]